MRAIRRHLSFANVVSLIALFVALGGASYAAFEVPKNSVGTSQLKRHAVTRAKIQPRAVGPGILADGAVGNAKLKNGAVGESKLARKAVGGAKLKNGAVSDSKLAPALLGAIHNPSVRFGGKHSFNENVTQSGQCGSGSSNTVPSAQFDRLVFVSYAANRTAGSGTTQYAVERPGGFITFSLTGTDSRAGESFFTVPAGSTYPQGAHADDDTCTGSGGTLNAVYYEVQLHAQGGQ